MVIMSNFDPRTFYQGYVDALNARELNRLDEFVNDEITYFNDAATRDQVIAAIGGELEAVPDLTWELTDFAVDNDNIAARLINTGTPVKEWLGVAPTGASFEIVEFAIYRLRDGRFTHMTNLHDAEALASQLGARSAGTRPR